MKLKLSFESIVEKHQIEAIIFDMDGLLVDSEPLWQKAEIEVFKTVNIELTLENCHETTGMPTLDVVNYWYKKLPWSEKSVEEINAALLKKAAELIAAAINPMPGVEKLLLKSRQMGLKIGLASASPMNIIEVVLTKLNLFGYFDFYHSAMLEKKNKPDPAVYLTVAQKLETPITKCLILEDSGNGVKGAVASQAVVVAVPSVYEFEDSKFNIANYKIHSLLEFC